MKKILPIILMASSIGAWAQTPIQVQTKTKTYDLSDAYSITFENGGQTQVIKTKSQGEIRVPLADLKQIYFNDTLVTLTDQIKNLEGCEIMKTILFEENSVLAPYMFAPYLNASNITRVFIPTDKAFEAIPVVNPKTPNLPCVLSVTLDKAASFPFRAQLKRYDPETGEVGGFLGITPSSAELGAFLKRLVMNQFAFGNRKELKTVTGSMIEESEEGYKGTYELEATRKGNKYQTNVNAVQVLNGSDNRKCIVTDAVLSETLCSTHEALQELSPKFLQLLEDIPLDLMDQLGFFDPDYEYWERTPYFSFFETLSSGKKKFRWNSTAVNYTIFAPTDEALEAAFRSGILLSWDEIRAMADNLIDSADWEIKGKYEVLEKVTELFFFINQHILFGNVMTDIPENTESKITTCLLTGNHTAQTVSVRRDKGNVFSVSTAKTIPSSIRYVKEVGESNYQLFFSDQMQSGVVMQIDKAITNE